MDFDVLQDGEVLPYSCQSNAGRGGRRSGASQDWLVLHHGLRHRFQCFYNWQTDQTANVKAVGIFGNISNIIAPFATKAYMEQ